MSHPLRRRASRLLAFVLLAVMATVPTAMAWADASGATTHTADHHHSPGSHDQLRDNCCDLCLTSCIACAGLIRAATTIQSRITPWVVAVVVRRAVRATAVPDQYRLPFPLGPPLLTA